MSNLKKDLKNTMVDEWLATVTDEELAAYITDPDAIRNDRDELLTHLSDRQLAEIVLFGPVTIHHKRDREPTLIRAGK